MAEDRVLARPRAWYGSRDARGLSRRPRGCSALWPIAGLCGF